MSALDVMAELQQLIRIQDGLHDKGGLVGSSFDPARTLSAHETRFTIAVEQDARLTEHAPAEAEEHLYWLLSLAAHLVRRARHIAAEPEKAAAPAGGGEHMTCSLCDRRATDATVWSCTHPRCPLAERHAA